MGIADKVLNKLGSLSFKDISLAWAFSSDLQKLRSTLTSIKSMLLDADEKQARNSELSTWLGQLKVILYEMEDFLDDLELEVLQKQVANREGTKEKVYHLKLFPSSNWLASCVKMWSKVKKLGKRLDEIAAQKPAFDFVEQLDMPFVHKDREIHHSYLQVSDIVGRDNDKENIIQQLMCLDDEEFLHVLPIVGTSGLGKTILAEMVFFDEWFAMQFEIKIMMPVPEDFDLRKMIKYMIRYSTGEICDDLDIEQLQTHLKMLLSARRFLLILEDVQNHHLAKWNKLKQLLMNGGRGSKIIITTRREQVAQSVGTVSPYHLQGLSDDECLSMFKKCAFEEGQEEKYPNLVKIGEQIVKKCRGIPFSVRCLGCSLYKCTNERDWLFVRDSEIWNQQSKEDGIEPALNLSFSLLPSCLKPCLAFCSVFEKGHLISSASLINFWMANNLILISSDGSKGLGETGMQYLKELIFRSFICFHDNMPFPFLFSVRMPNGIHDLVRQVAATEHSRISSTMQNVSENVRHLSLSSSIDMSSEQLSEFLKKSKSVSSIFLFPDEKSREQHSPLVGKSILDICVSRFLYLRVFSLVDSNFEEIPNSISMLKHLRYVNLTFNRKLREIPASMCRLKSLQTLNLNHCLGLKRLPANMGSLFNLQTLVITTQERCLPTENGIACLSSLRHLKIVACCNLESLFKGMQCLKALQILVIDGCPLLRSLPCSIKYLKALDTLIISNCSILNLDFLTAEEETEDGSCDLSSLRTLVIKALPKLEALPLWLLQASANILCNISIDFLPELKALPDELETLLSLQKLRILNCLKLTALPQGMQNLSSLKELIIFRCSPELSRRCQPPMGGQDWPKIAHVPEFYIDGLKIAPEPTQ